MQFADFSVVIPVRNPSDLLWLTLSGIRNQLCQPREIIVIVDGGREPDLVEDRIRTWIDADSLWRIEKNQSSLGLAEAYNRGVQVTQSPIIVFVHQDIVPENLHSLCDLVEPFSDENVVAVGHRNLRWKSDLIDKASIALLGFLCATQYKDAVGWDGKFDAVRRSALNQIGGFDRSSFKSAGEDGDILYRLSQVGKIHNSVAGVHHLQTLDEFTWHDYLKKRYQYAEALGALLRRGSTKGVNALQAMWRELCWIFVICGIVGCVVNSDAVAILLLGICGWIPLPFVVARDSRRPFAVLLLFGIEPLASLFGIAGFVKGFVNKSARFSA